jgi:hypothetical protein
MGAVQGVDGLLRSLERDFGRFTEHALGQTADRRVMHIKCGPSQDATQAAFAHRARRFLGKKAAGIDEAGGSGPNELKLSAERRPIGILGDQRAFVAVEPL